MKLLLLIFSLMSLKNRKKTLDSSTLLIDSIKVMIRKELSTIIYKTLIGILLIGITIIAFNKSSNAFQIIMARFENGYILEFIGFIVIAMASLFFLHRLFNISVLIRTDQSLESNKKKDSVDLEMLAFSFLEGFRESMANPSKNKSSSES